MWEYGVPVELKNFADPSMQSIPACCMNVDKQMWLGQSQDNQIVSYSSAKGEKFRFQKNKVFKGHNTAGYACTVNFSPDSKYVLSGDSKGRCFFWEWAHPQKVRPAPPLTL
ncbi:WD_REPEATS_REGION domain-containing protein, partial [Haematococcus lacustris]